MKLIYAKFWLKKYIKHNHDKFDEKTFNRKLNWSIVNLSHRVFKSHGSRGHNTRQKIRKILWAYSKEELKLYRPSMTNKIINYLKGVINKIRIKF
jgi:hypothetical protein